MILTQRETRRHLARPTQDLESFVPLDPEQLSAETETLYLSDSPTPEPVSLEFLSRVPKLRFLSIATPTSDDGSGRHLQVESLAPLSSLPHLEFVSLIGVQTVRDRLEPLHSLSSLQAAWVENAGFFRLEDYARLAKSHEGLRGIAPLFCPRYSDDRCPRCRWRRTLYFQGADRPKKRDVCSACDHELILRQLKRWDDLGGSPTYGALSPWRIRRQFRP